VHFNVFALTFSTLM